MIAIIITIMIILGMLWIISAIKPADTDLEIKAKELCAKNNQSFTKVVISNISTENPRVAICYSSIINLDSGRIVYQTNWTHSVLTDRKHFKWVPNE